jgi:hypothetical protein
VSYYPYDPYDDDSGVGRYILLSEKFHRARKDHACSTCKTGIKAGSVYRAQFILEEGDKPFAMKACDDCVAEEYGVPRPEELEAMIRADEAEVAGR